MRRARYGAVMAALLLTACAGSPLDPAAEFSAAPPPAKRAEVAAPADPPATLPAAAPVTVTTVATLARPTTTVPTTATTTASGPYAPAPPPPGVAPFGYGGYGGLATVTTAGTAFRLQAYPREQYLGEPFFIGVEAEGPVAVFGIRLDLADGTSHYAPEVAVWTCPTPIASHQASTAVYHSYAKAGVYTLRATVTFGTCTLLPGPPPGTELPPGSPSGPLLSIGTPQTATVELNVVQRSDHVPPPVGPAPGP